MNTSTLYNKEECGFKVIKTNSGFILKQLLFPTLVKQVVLLFIITTGIITYGIYSGQVCHQKTRKN